jgi:adenosylhomocysteine nucleosidase
MRQRSTDQSHSGQRVERGVAPPPVPADVGIVAALSIEVGDLIDNLKKVRKYQSVTIPVVEGEYGGKIIAVAIGGPGRPAARRAADVLIAGHRPRWIISAGFAGGLNPALARNDLVLPHEVIDLEGRRFPVEVPATLTLGGFRQTTGRLLTVDRLVLNAEEKESLWRTHEADLVDMESSAVAELCVEKFVRFLCLRAISDDAHTKLPREVATLLSQSGSYRVGAAMRALWNRPSSLKDFWTLHERALEAADRLAKVVTRCLDELPA